MKGHVRFTDAFMKNTPENGAVKTTEHILQILSTPRTTAFEFYLKKPVENATYWNFDFYGVTESDENSEQSHTSYHHLDKAAPRGRKMYWHHNIAPDAGGKQKMNNTMKSIDDGDFGFRVYFDQISREQLADLIWTINLGENSEKSKYLHKLGHAKPLGYGSVKLIVEGGAVRRFTKDENGAYAFDGMAGWFSPAVPTVPVDGTGAGDCHIGTMIACSMMGHTLQESLDDAAVNSAAVVGRHGAALTEEEFLALP